MYAAIGILAALNLRQLTGKGQAIDISLLDAAVSLGVYEAACYFATGERPPRLGQAHRGTSPYQVFRSQDGWLTIGGGAQHLWDRICAALDLQSLKQDPRFVDNAARVANNRELVELMQERLATRPTAYWLTRFDELNVPAGPVLTHDQVFADPHLRQREMIVDLLHPVVGPTRTMGTPLKLSLTPACIRSAAPRLGEHTEEVLRELRRESEEEVAPL
jgi:crotonobetainyl-CoA:carnitine CoA-transferase CaiB-like acyl-CoA transferase